MLIIRPTCRRLFASAAASAPPGAGGNPLRPPPTNLLPPIPLYRRVLRANRKLPAEQRTLGDMYAKAEFRAHRSVDNPTHLIGFLSQWQLYAQQVEGDTWRDDKIDKMQLEKLSEQQIGQLYELMQTIKKKHAEEDGGPPEPPESK
ncbi:ACN9-domain-containing protein [Zalerion maritima]|uniref:Succinate dehydrogenase assembly factor 3 n=1 Tax=Zalerion maritima TaxID=339359 RepID=A0AAD5RNU1_9PEZI|nr:ACN9-domain-containing protein [Zalerion maritima]